MWIVTTDRYPGYNWIEPHHRQVCWAHLKRDFQAVSEHLGDSQTIDKALLEQSKHLFDLQHRVRDGTLSKSDFQVAIEPVNQKIGGLLDEGTVSEHSKTRNICKNILKLEDSLWTFTRIEGVEPTSSSAILMIIQKS